jgi:hypothetical protein
MRRRPVTRILPVLTALLVLSVLAPGVASRFAAPPAAADTPGGQLVSEVPARGTPHVLDGRVYAIAQVGDRILLGGTFTAARNDSGDTSVVVRHGLLAFDAATGTIDPAFHPDPDGDVRTILAAGDGRSVYVGGDWSRIAGTSRARVARLRVADGSVVGAFDARAVTGQVRDLALSGGRLWVGGAFTRAGGRAQGALTTLDPTTGRARPYMSLRLAGTHRGGVTQVLQLDVSPDGTRLVAVGNFATLAGVRNHQLLLLDLSGARAAPGPWRTSFFTDPCSPVLDTYLRDVDFSPDGTYLVVATAGAYGGSTRACDTVSRFETRSSGDHVAPSWVDYSGGDTTYAVEATGAAVYVGGHERWWNNPHAGGRPGPGAVSREGVAALDPANGLPLTWDPTRDKGVGVFDFLLTTQGLWITSDTDRIGDYQYRGRVALMPPDGATYPAVTSPRLPAEVYSAGVPHGAVATPGSGVLVRRWFDGATAGASSDVPPGDVDWSAIRGAFVVGGDVYLAAADGSFSERSFDGAAFGPPAPVDTADRLTALTAWARDAARATGMFLEDGRLYFTLAGSDRLFYRYFSPQSGVVGAQRLVAATSTPGLRLRGVRGMFLAGSVLCWATRDGDLHSITWRHAPVAGSPVPGTARVVSGPGVDGVSWAARALFVGP